MSEDDTKITSSEPVHIKDPRRVAAGKKLGAISKVAKEKKARERYNRERELEATEGMDWKIPIGIGVTGLVGLCYVCYTSYKKVEPVSPEPVPQEVRSTRERRALDSFDG